MFSLKKDKLKRRKQFAQRTLEHFRAGVKFGLYQFEAFFRAELDRRGIDVPAGADVLETFCDAGGCTVQQMRAYSRMVIELGDDPMRKTISDDDFEREVKGAAAFLVLCEEQEKVYAVVD
jgi:hypothetical protein